MVEKDLLGNMERKNVSEVIIQRITDSLIRGDLKPGDKIPTEIEFKERLGVGRNCVREAVKVLQAFGVLEIRRSEGTFVVSDFKPNLLDPTIYGIIMCNHSKENLLDYKLAIMGAILFIAVQKVTPQDIKLLKQDLDEFRAAFEEDIDDIETIYQKAIKFNIHLGETTKNPMLVQQNIMAVRIAKFTRHSAIVASIRMGEADALPNMYANIVAFLEKQDRTKAIEMLDHISVVWRKLLT